MSFKESYEGELSQIFERTARGFDSLEVSYDALFPDLFFNQNGSLNHVRISTLLKVNGT